MNSIETAKAARREAIALRTWLALRAQRLEGRAATTAWKKVEIADRDVQFAQANVERAVRLSMGGSPERDIMAEALAV